MHRFIPFIAMMLMAFCAAAHADVADDAIKATGIERGLCVVVGTGDATLDAALAKRGTFVVERLLTDWKAVYDHRAALAKADVFPLANAQYVRDFKTLPYAPQLVNLLIIDADALGKDAPTDDEVKRVVAWGGKAYVKRSGTWSVIDNPYPEDTDEWSHSLHGPTRTPISKDKRINGNIDGMKWAAESYRGIEQRGFATLVHNGKHFSMRSGFNRDLTDKQWPLVHTLVARSAASGIVLWTRDIAFLPVMSSRHISQSFNAMWAAGNNRIYGYPDLDKPLMALDADTGKVVKVYDALPVPERGKAAFQWSRGELRDYSNHERPADRFFSPERGEPTPLKDPYAMARSTVLVVGPHLVHTYGSMVWVVDQVSGEILGKQDLGEKIWSAAMGADGHLYVVAEKSAFSFTVPKAEQRWKTTYRAKTTKFDFVLNFTGPGDSVLAFYAADEIESSQNAKGNLIALDTATGKELWRNRGSVTGKHIVMDGDVVMTDGWKNGTYYSGRTGAEIGEHPVDFDMGGCSYPTYTEQYMIRGLTLHSRKNPQDILIGDGARSACQNPLVPAYGQLFSFGFSCGCSIFYRAGLSSFYPAAEPTPTPDEQRLSSDVNISAPEGPISRTSIKSLLTDDWGRGEGFYEGSKGFNLKAVPGDVRKQMSDFFKASKKGWQRNKPANWYNDGQRVAEADGWQLESAPDSNIVEARSGDKVAWTLPVGGRLIVDPLIIGDTAYIGVADGWVHAVELKTGKTKWIYQTAPDFRRMVACGQVESAWPVSGLQEINGHLVIVAGRRDSFDGGIFVTGLDPVTGKKRFDQNVTVPQKHYTSVKAAQADGYSGFGRKKSTLASPLYKGDDENTWWMVGATPIKIPAKP